MPSSFHTIGGPIYITVTKSENDEGIEFPVGNHMGGGPRFQVYPKGSTPKAVEQVLDEYVKAGLPREVELSSGEWSILSTGSVQATACAPASIDNVVVARR